MAKCDIAIELDDADALHAGGGRIFGVVNVQVHDDVECKGLEVSSGWRTHGRGNVASDTTETKTLYSGPWRAGETHAYRFELPIAPWPPTYHGHYLNIDHYVDARAKIPWAFDPKDSVPFQVRPVRAPANASAHRASSRLQRTLGWVVGAIIAMGFTVFFIAALARGGAVAWLFLLVPVLIFLFWFIKYFLPKYALGDIGWQIHRKRVAPGDPIRGVLSIRPRKNVNINGVRVRLNARERCVSGSGTNRTTHSHKVFEQVDTLSEATTLRAGQEHRFELSALIPPDAPYSIDLDDNELIWSITLLVDIPRWPDWSVDEPIIVVPTESSEKVENNERSSDLPVASMAAAAAAASVSRGPAVANETVVDASSEPEITLAETVAHLWAVRDDQTQAERLADAVAGMTFDVEAVIERRLLYGGDDDPFADQDHHVVWAHYPEPPVPLVLYIPQHLGDDLEQAGTEIWRGRGTVVGWDRQHRRLQIKIDSMA